MAYININIFQKLWSRFYNKASVSESTKPTRVVFEMMRDIGNGFYSWNGSIYHSDIVRAAIRPKVNAVGKLVAKHIRETVLSDGTNDIKTNPEAYIKFLLSEPNPYMTGQMLQQKLAAQLAINSNAFALVVSDNNGYPIEIYPIPCISAEAVYDEKGILYIKFYYANGKTNTFPYSSIIHLRQDFCENDIFGTSIAPVLAPLMQIISTTDQGIVKAIKNSAIVQWLLKFTNSLRPEALEEQAKNFAKSYLDIENDNVGVAAVDSKAEAVQVKPNEYIPNAAQMDRTRERIYSILGTNSKIVQSSFTEDEWNSYYESEIEPLAIQMSEQWSLRLFTRHERAFGNRIIFEAANLTCASITTKLALVAMVDRGALLPNEWRAVFNLGPIAGGDEPIRRLDTAQVTADNKSIIKTINSLAAMLEDGEK